jgi:hypothetical protein
MRNTADVTDGKPIAVLLQSNLGVSAINPLVAFYDIHGGKRVVLFFYFVPDTTGDNFCLFNFINIFEELDGPTVRAIAEAKHREQMPWIGENLLSRAPPCFGRHVKPLVPAAFAVVCTQFQGGLTSGKRSLK